MPGYTPPVGFHFKVEFLGIPNLTQNDSRFQKVSGLTITQETESLKEGGENSFKHELPNGPSFGQLELTRGLLKDSALVTWFNDCMYNLDIKPIDLKVYLFGEDSQELMSWDVTHAFPVEWSISEFDAESSTLAIESIKLKFRYFKLAS